MFANPETPLVSEVHAPDPDSSTIRVGGVWYDRKDDDYVSCDQCSFWLAKKGCPFNGLSGKFSHVKNTCVATSTHFIPSSSSAQQELF